MLTDGFLDLTRAMHIAPRGFAKIVGAAIDSYKGKDKDADALIAHKAELLKVVDSYTGDGKFKVKVEKDAKGHAVTVRATGKSLSDVVPAAALVPVVLLGIMEAEAASAPPPPPAKAQPAKPVKPRSTGGVTKPPAKKP